MELRTDRYKLKEVFPDRAKKYAQKYHIKADEIEYVRKGIPIDPAEISIEEGERAAIRLITTPRLDRDGEILLPDGAVLDDFRQSPSVLFGHQYDKLPVGKDLWIKPTKKGILAKTAYANHQFAEDVFQCVKGGFLNSNSVGFIPLDRINQGDAGFKDMADRLEKEYGVPGEEAKAAKSIYTKWLLLEHSDVPVPSNAQSLNIAVSKGELIIGSPSLKEQLGVDNKTVEPSDPLAPMITDSAVQPKIDFCNTCGTPLGEMVTKSEKYECECIKCGHKATFEEHCKDVKCPKCGGEMRRAERPGPGRAVEDGIVTKPETTENYHRIPVSDGHEGHRIRTITISAEQGIKALYCGTCKEVATYLFDTDKWTMAEAQEWIDEHKEGKAVDWILEPAKSWADLATGLLAQVHDLSVKLEAIDAKQQAPAIEPKPIEPPPAPIPAKHSFTAAEVQEFLNSPDMKVAVNEAIKVGLAKIRGKVI